MSLRVVQPGSGSPRPLVLVYHVSSARDAAFTSSVPSSVAIANDTGPSGVGYYDTVPPLSQTLATLSQQLGASLSPVVLVGFSEGGFATNRLLKLGADPDALILADATYGGDLAAWKAYAARALSGERVMVASHSSNTFMEATGHPSPWRNLQSITGLTLPLGNGACIAQPRPNAPLATAPVITSSGNVRVHSYPDCDHTAQGASVLPTILIPEALAMVGVKRGSWWPWVVGAAALVAALGLGAGVGWYLDHRA